MGVNLVCLGGLAGEAGGEVPLIYVGWGGEEVLAFLCRRDIVGWAGHSPCHDIFACRWLCVGD